MTCGACVETVRRALAGVEGAHSATVSLQDASAEVLCKPSSTIAHRIRSARRAPASASTPRRRTGSEGAGAPRLPARSPRAPRCSQVGRAPLQGACSKLVMFTVTRLEFPELARLCASFPAQLPSRCTRPGRSLERLERGRFRVRKGARLQCAAHDVG
ncbi:unnamed protein product [Prorocentrum cordatum]|uniref:HMA domain-containing protein n=1 Tax=Prorocentrum cordatum TaxID=2364126 RepID=A0ABN9U5A5_9DINO|nr:unnamed protein product [Polarella glacialis]